MIEGLFRKERLLTVIKDFIYFPDNSDKELKIVCHYPHFFAVTKLSSCICLLTVMKRAAPSGGVTGCGKSYTMLLLVRMLMKRKLFHTPTILIITDCTDLDDQLSRQFVNSPKYIGGKTVVNIESCEKLREELQGRESCSVYLTIIQKFMEDLQLLTDRTNVICISDEARRRQINLDQKVKVNESVYDGITVNLVYKGRAARVMLDNEKVK